MSGSQNFEHLVHVRAGLKAALHNSNVSDEAKAHAQKQLDSMDTGTGEALTARQLAGYKAALSNPNVSAEAKERAGQVLESNGAGVPTAHEDENLNHILAGYKAALHNARVGEEAKRHAEDVLREHDAL